MTSVELRRGDGDGGRCSCSPAPAESRRSWPALVAAMRERRRWSPSCRSRRRATATHRSTIGGWPSRASALVRCTSRAVPYRLLGLLLEGWSPSRRPNCWSRRAKRCCSSASSIRSTTVGTGRSTCSPLDAEAHRRPPAAAQRPTTGGGWSELRQRSGRLAAEIANRRRNGAPSLISTDDVAISSGERRRPVRVAAASVRAAGGALRGRRRLRWGCYFAALWAWYLSELGCVTWTVPTSTWCVLPGRSDGRARRSRRYSAVDPPMRRRCACCWRRRSAGRPRVGLAGQLAAAGCVVSAVAAHQFVALALRHRRASFKLDLVRPLTGLGAPSRTPPPTSSSPSTTAPSGRCTRSTTTPTRRRRGRRASRRAAALAGPARSTRASLHTTPSWRWRRRRVFACRPPRRRRLSTTCSPGCTRRVEQRCSRPTAAGVAARWPLLTTPPKRRAPGGG